MKDWQERLYPTRKWKMFRESFAKSRGYLCEMCLKEGRAEPGIFVHHIIPVTALNVDNPEITLNPENCMLLCRDHHAAVHRKQQKRYKIDELGRVIII